jgi:hypothetical protein
VHILHCCHLADIQDVIRDVLSQMGAKACASSAKQASKTALVQKKRKNTTINEPLEEEKFQSAVGTAMSSVVCGSVVKKNLITEENSSNSRENIALFHLMTRKEHK